MAFVYKDNEAYKEFIKLYCGSQRKDRKAWTDYFISVMFLEVCRKKEFTELLLEEVIYNKEKYPPSKEFLTALHLAYLFTSKEAVYRDHTDRSFCLYKESAIEDMWIYSNRRLETGADFEGIEDIFEIAKIGPVPRKLMGNDQALFLGYIEYWHLEYLAEHNKWDEDTIQGLGDILGRYAMAYIKDKCEKRLDRHPASLRLLYYFFEKYHLPDPVYRVLWKQLHLESAQYGKAKIYYGKLRECVLKNVPDIEGTKIDYLQLSKAVRFYTNNCEAWGEEECAAETNQLFAREDMQAALRDPLAVKERVLRLWVNGQVSAPFLRHIIEFYIKNLNIPMAQQIIDKAEEYLYQKEIEERFKRENEAPILEAVSLANASCFRYWLNIAFYSAKDLETGRCISEYLAQKFCYPDNWSRRFLATPKQRKIKFLDKEITLVFHLFYIEYYIDQEILCKPFLLWEELKEICQDKEEFLLLLPITWGWSYQLSAVIEELMLRLEDTPLPKEDILVLAGILAGNVCRVPTEEEENFPLELYKETTGKLYGCEWLEKKREVCFFEQTPTGRNYIRDRRYTRIINKTRFFSLADKVFKEIVGLLELDISFLKKMPDIVYVTPDKEYQTVRKGQLQELFDQFSQNQWMRLELSWNVQKSFEIQDYQPRRSLVLLNDNGKYACMFFDDQKGECHYLLSMPEVYSEVDEKDVIYQPFLMGILPNYNIHKNFFSIQSKLNRVLREVSVPDKIGTYGAEGGFFWSLDVFYQKHRRYYICKQALGGFPLEWSYRRPTAKFVFSKKPISIGFESLDGKKEEKKISQVNQTEAGEALVSFVLGKLKKLCLVWEWEETWQSYIVLLQDQGKYMMAYLRDDIKSAEYYVADVKGYMEVEGKDYTKEIFLGKTMPAYLIHQDILKIRNGLDIIFDNFLGPVLAVNRFGEFAKENPIKPRDYQKIKKELVGE